MRGKNTAPAAIAWVISLSVAMAQPPQAGGNNSQSAAQNPGVKTSQFGDWAMNCRKAEASSQSPQTCELVQTILINGQQNPFAQLAIGRLKGENPLLITILAPHNIALPGSVRIAVDDKDATPLEAPWTRCVKAGCFASAVLKDDILNKWRSLETRGRVTFKAGNGQNITIPISFRGLKNALDALQKEK